LFYEDRRLLSVPRGGRGLAQNEAVFQHVANLPELFGKVPPAGDFRLAGVAASTRPRPVEGSYMPVFRVAESYGKSMAGLLRIPFAETSHQEGHLAVGVWSAQGPPEREFLAVHLSGGTTEILQVARRGEGEGNTFDIRLLGGTGDLHAGQFIDRIGVKLGLPFPAGPHLELLARKSEKDISLPSSVKGFKISFSGPETAALRLIEQKVPAPEIARAVEKCIVNSLEKLIKKAVEETGLGGVLVVGGVAANKFIRERLSTGLPEKVKNTRLYFAPAEFSSDNAVGVALIGMSRLKGKNSDET